MASPDNKMEFEFILYEIEPIYVAPLEVEVPTHKHKKRSNLTLDFPTFANTPNLDLNDYSTTSTPSTSSTSNSINSSNPSSTLISRVNSKDDGSNIYKTSNPMSPSNSSDRGRGRATSLGSSSGHVRSKSPGSPINETLVADMKMSKNRIVVSRKYTVYDHEAVPYHSCIVGFNISFHNPPSARSRVKDAEFNIYFFPAFEGSELPSPVIKAISPSNSNQSSIGATTATEHKKSHTAALSLCYNPGGSLSFSRGHETTWTELTSAKLIVSGVETNHAMITLEEDPRTLTGIPSSIDFAILVELPSSSFAASPPSPTDPQDQSRQMSSSVTSSPLSPLVAQDLSRGFEVDFTFESSVGLVSHMGSGVRRYLGSPREWRIGYDGFTQVGKIDMKGDLEVDGSIAVKKD